MTTYVEEVMGHKLSLAACRIGDAAEAQNPKQDVYVLLQKGERAGWVWKYYLIYYNPLRRRIIYAKASRDEFEKAVPGTSHRNRWFNNMEPLRVAASQ